MKLDDLRDAASIRTSLIVAGLPPEAAEQKLKLLEQCRRALNSRTIAETYAFFVPGRIEVLGKHTDYAGGDSLLCAVSHGFCFVASKSDSLSLTLVNATSGEREELPANPSDEKESRRGHWSNYPNSVWRRLRHNLGGQLEGCTLAFASDLPSAAGISSSSALVVGTFLALDAVNNIRSRPAFKTRVPNKESLGDYLGCVENGRDYPGMPGTLGVGTTGGSQDQTAIICAVADQLQHFSFAPTTLRESVPMPEGFAFVVASSGVTAAKTGDALDHYNRVGARASEIVRLWNMKTGEKTVTLGDIVRRRQFDPRLVREMLASDSGDQFSSSSLIGRFDQFYAESYEIIPSAVAALQANRLHDFAAAVRRSQNLAEEHLENQVPATIGLVELAIEEGALAASAFGAGFGGSVWAMVREDAIPSFVSRWTNRYRMLFRGPARQSRFFVERPGPGAFQIKVL